MYLIIIHEGQLSLLCILANALLILLHFLNIKDDFLNIQVIIVINDILWARVTSVGCHGGSGPTANCFTFL